MKCIVFKGSQLSLWCVFYQKNLKNSEKSATAFWQFTGWHCSSSFRAWHMCVCFMFLQRSMKSRLNVLPPNSNSTLLSFGGNLDQYNKLLWIHCRIWFMYPFSIHPFPLFPNKKHRWFGKALALNSYTIPAWVQPNDAFQVPWLLLGDVGSRRIWAAGWVKEYPS